MQYFVEILFHLSLVFSFFSFTKNGWFIHIFVENCCYPRLSMRFTAKIDGIHTTYYIWLIEKFLLFNFISFLVRKNIWHTQFCLLFCLSVIGFSFYWQIASSKKAAIHTNLQTKKAIFYACKSAEHTKYIRIFSIQFRCIFHFSTFIYSDMPPAFIYSLLFILLWKYYKSQIYKRYCFQSHRLNDNCVCFFGKHEIGRAR